MKRINHTIKRKKIPEVKLVSLTGKTWYDYRESDENLISWNEWDYSINYKLNDVVGYFNLYRTSASNGCSSTNWIYCIGNTF